MATRTPSRPGALPTGDLRVTIEERIPEMTDKELENLRDNAMRLGTLLWRMRAD